MLVSHSFENNTRAVYHPNVPYPLGLAYLASSLEEAGHKVDVLWLSCFQFLLAHRLLLSELDRLHPDVLGIQMLSVNRVSSYRLIEHCLANYPELPIVVGGIHASLMAEQIVERFKKVIVVIGEGEATLLELLSAIGAGGDLARVKGIAYWRGDAVVRTEERDLLYAIDSLPHPKHILFFDAEPERTTGYILTSRGCPFECSFCCLYPSSRRKYRERNTDDVVSEIVGLKHRYPRLRTVVILDDTFTLDNDRVVEFCQRIIALDLNIDFIAAGRVKPVAEEMLGYMEKAGFRRLEFGVETGAENLMHNNRKGITRADVEDLFRKISRFNIAIAIYLIVGLPGEDEDTVDETVSFVKNLQNIRYFCLEGLCKLWAYPGTEIYEIMKASGHISDQFWLTDRDVPYFTAEHNLSALMRFEQKMLAHLSTLKILTLDGFRYHFLDNPATVLRFLRQNRHLAKAILVEAVKTPAVALTIRFPGLLDQLRRLRRRILLPRERYHLKRLYG